MPKRIQRSRRKGWRMPENAVYVGRPTKFGNPFRLVSKIESVKRYEGWLRYLCTDPDLLLRREWILDNLEMLRGKDLCCWCSIYDGSGRRVPCHADILLEMANR